jgi:serine/threonine-protein kinase
MGVVYQARDEILGRDVALKVLLASPELRLDLVRRFIRESKIAAQLQHPGIPAVYELGWLIDGRPFLAMKLIHGQMLAALLSAGAADRPRLLTIFEQLCQTVAYAHAQRIVHRDLKPTNVMVGPFGEVQLVDWGLARGLGEPPPNAETATESPTLAGGISPHSQVTDPNQFLGTPTYMAPERMRGEVGDCRSDVYSLGAVLHEILTGKPPIWSDRLLLSRLIPGSTGMEPLEASGADPLLIRLASRCLSADPQKRPADASELAQTLMLYREGVAEQVRQLEHEKTAQKIRLEEGNRRRRLITLGVSLGAVLLLCLAGLLWHQSHLEEQRLQRARVFLAEIDRQTTDALGRHDWDQLITVLEPALPQFELHDSSGTSLHRAKEHLQTAYLVKELVLIRREGRLVSTRERRVRLPADQYAHAFCKYGWNLQELSAETFARQLEEHPAREEILNGLYAWKSAERDDKLREQLRAWLRAGDRDPWRLGLLALNDPPTEAEAREVARELPPTPQPPELLIDVARSLDQIAPGEGLRFRRAVQQRFPHEFWYALDLSSQLSNSPAFFQEALTYARVAVALRPQEAVAWNNLGILQLLNGDNRGARQSLARAVEQWPDRGSLRLNYALALLGNREYERAAQEMQRGKQLAPDLIEAEYIRGVLAAARQDEATTRQAFQQVWNTADAPWHLRDSVLFLMPDLLESKVLQGELTKRPAAGLFYALSHAHLRQGKLDSADQALNEAIRLAPWHSFLLMESARLAERRKDIAPMMDRAAQALLLDPDQLESILFFKSFSDYSRPLPGLELLTQRIFTRYPERPEGWILLALHQLQNNQFTQALKSCQRALSYRESQASARLLQGVALERLGRIEAAQTAYFLSHALKPDDPRPLIGIATLWLQRRKPDQAEATFRAMARLGMAPAQVVRGQTEVLLARGKSLAAIHYLEGQLDQFPNDLELLSLRGVLAWQAGRLAEAETWLQKVLAQDARHLHARVNLGQVQLAQNKFALGLATLKQALDQAPNDAQLLAIYGTALLQHEKPRDAEPILLRARRLNPRDLQVSLGLAALYLESNRAAEARGLLAQATHEHPENAQLAALHGQSLLRLHRYRESAAELERSSRLLPLFSPNRARLNAQLGLARQLIQMEARLDAVLAGKAQASISETIDLIDLFAAAKQKPLEAAEWAVRFLDEHATHRFAPAQNVYLRAGVLALQAAQADPAQAPRWRRQALTWLERQRKEWVDQVCEDIAPVESLSTHRQRVNTLEELRCVRDPSLRAKLPRDEAAAWKKFFDWATPLNPPIAGGPPR